MNLNAEQVKTAVQWLVGVVTPVLAHYGLSPDEIGLWGALAAQVVPPAAMFAWAMYDRTHKNTIAQAAKILEAPDLKGNKSGTIVVSPDAKDGAAAAAADGKVTNVDYGKVQS